MRPRNYCRPQVEEFEPRYTPSSLGALTLDAPDGPESHREHHHHHPIPSVLGTYSAVVSVSDMTGPVTATFTITKQHGAHFEAMINAAGLTLDLKGELNPAKGTVHFIVAIDMGGHKTLLARGEGTFTTGPTCPTGASQVMMFDVMFSFKLPDGTTGTGTASIHFVPPGGGLPT
jgi:hypothetical protein